MIFPSSVKFKSECVESAFNETIKGPLTTDKVQRNYVWPEKIEIDRVSQFIEDFLQIANTPYSNRSNSIGQIVFLEDKKTNTFAVLDGLQRMTTLYKFIECSMNKAYKQAEHFSFADRKEIYKALKPYFRFLKSLFKLQETPEAFQKNNKNQLATAGRVIYKNKLFVDYFYVDNSMSTAAFINKVKELFSAILKSQISFCCVDDEITAYNFFLLLNSGAPLEAYEFLKVKLSGCPGYNLKSSTAIAELDKLFVYTDKNDDLVVDETLVQCCLYGFGKSLFKTDTKTIPTNLKSTILEDSFTEYTLDTKNYTDGSNFLIHCLNVKTHIEDIQEHFENQYNIDEFFKSDTVKKFMSLSFKDNNFKSSFSDYLKLFLVVEVLQQIPKAGEIFSGSLWNEGLSKIRTQLVNKAGVYSISTLRDEVKNIYRTRLRKCLIDFVNNPKKEFLDQSTSSSQNKKMKRIFLLIETALNKSTLPVSGSYEVEHIQPKHKQGTNIIGNLCLLEKDINSSLNMESSWTSKYTPRYGGKSYQDSTLWLPKMIFGHFPSELTNPINQYLQPDTVVKLQQLVSSGPVVNLDDRVNGSQQHLGLLLDFAVQRILEGI